MQKRRKLANNLGVTSETKRLSHLRITDLIAAKEFLVDRDAYIYLDRLHEALAYKDERQASHMCKLLIRHFDFDPTNDVLDNLKIANTETLQKSNLSLIRIYGLDLSDRKNVKRLFALISRCPQVKKIELGFCSLTNEVTCKLFEETMKLETLHYLGVRGNKLDTVAVHMLHTLLERSENFPSLMWVDFRNNKGIITISGDLVNLLMQRRTKYRGLNGPDDRKSIISIQDAINGRLV
ncbi:uncharacterized protein [Montipora capricornis]|uniref:uncharacterized protein n=1 Tax=Montipora capricornis TaxID=246305 RepID=UPI0035F10CE1